MFCSNCGANNNDGAKFCFSCGAPLNQTATPVDSQPVEPVTTAFSGQEETVAPINPPVVSYTEPVGQESQFYAEPAMAQQSQPKPPKKKNNKVALIAGLVAGVLVVVAAVVAILFATDVIDVGSDKKETTEATESKKKDDKKENETEEENKEETPDKNAKDYTIKADVEDVEGNVIEEDKEITFQIPYGFIEHYDAVFDEFEMAIGDFSFVVDPECTKFEDNYYIEIAMMGGEEVTLVVMLTYSGEEMTMENYCAGMVEMYFPDVEGSEVTIEYAVDKDENAYATISINEEIVNAYTSTGYSKVDGVCYDPQGNEIDEGTFAKMFDNVANDVLDNLGV